MPNPVFLTAARDGFVKVSREASYLQRVALKQGGEVIVQTSPIPNGITTNGIDAGTYEVQHEYKPGGGSAWRSDSRGQKINEERAHFDDNPTGGDNDFNDARVWFEYP